MPGTITTRESTTRNLQFRAASLNQTQRTADVVIATEAPVDFGRYREVLLMSGARFAESVPFLDSHNRSSIDNVLGSIRGIRREGSKLIGVAHFANSERGDAAMQLLSEGHLTDASAGYRIDDEVLVEKGKRQIIEGRVFEGGPTYVVRQWQLKETSAVPVGADENSTFRGESMDIKTPDKEQEKPAEERADKEAKIDTSLEDKRQIEIMRLCEISRFVDGNDAMRYIKSGMSVEAVRKDILAEMELKCKPLKRSVSMEGDAFDKYREGIVYATLDKGGIAIPEDKREMANTFRNESVSDIASRCLESQGRWFRGSRNDIIQDALGSRRGPCYRSHGWGARAAAHSTSDFSNVLGNILNKALQVGYTGPNITYPAYTMRETFNDFKENKLVNLSLVSGDLEEVPEGGEITYTTLSDSGETWQCGTFARGLVVTRQLLVNDDLGAFARLSFLLGQSAARTVQKKVSSVWNDGATSTWNMSDGNPLFDASNHGNYNASGSALDVTPLDTAGVAMSAQTDANGVLLGVSPRFLIVAPKNRFKALQLLSSAAVPTANLSSGVFNPFADGSLQLIVDPFIQTAAGGDDDNWGLAADPGTISTIHVGFLNGVDAPQIEEKDEFETFGTRFRIWIDYAVKPGDWRGLYKVNVA